MNIRVTLSFLLALAVLLVAVVGLDRFNIGQPTSETATPAPEAQIFEFDDARATAFTGRSGETTVRFEKAEAENAWVIAESQLPANRTALTSLIIRLSSLQGTTSIGNTGDLGPFGLTSPQHEMTVELDDGTTFTLQLGDSTPVGTGTYAKKADAPDVYVVASTFASDLDRLVNNPALPPTPTPFPTSTPTTVPTPGPGTPTAVSTPGDVSPTATSTPTP